MKFSLLNIIVFSIFVSGLIAQEENCFLFDFKLKNAVIPPSFPEIKTTMDPDVTVTVDRSDTTGRISKYIFGNAMAVWIGNDIFNETVYDQLKLMSPTLIRYPGGSWSNIFFWDGVADSVPDQIYIASSGSYEQPQFGKGSWTSDLDSYYDMLWEIDAQGLITINYGYARYGTSVDPVARAAHYAAEWVRYDDGRTKFWEIGNENAGPWEAGWEIDTTLNQDGQPQIITGSLYGKHFKIIADSMRTAAAEIDVEIYIGGQVLHYDGTNSWNVPDRMWNEGFFSEAGDIADYYVMHNYYGPGNTQNVNNILSEAQTVPKQNIDFIRQDAAAKGAPDKPVTITEWNMNVLNSAAEEVKTSIVNGMQAVIALNEMIKNNYGMSARWLIASGSTDLFYTGNDGSIPDWSPRPEFFYMYYLQKFTGNHALKATSGSPDIAAYSTTFNSGEVGVILVNKSTSEHIVEIKMQEYGLGGNYYVYSLTGADGSDLPQQVMVNDEEPTDGYWGPLENLENIEAQAYLTEGGLKIVTPGRSVQFIMIESEPFVTSLKETTGNPQNFGLEQNYPNPFNPITKISYHLAENDDVQLSIYNLLGQKVATLVSEKQSAGTHSIEWKATGFASGLYMYKLETSSGYSQSRKLLLLK